MNDGNSLSTLTDQQLYSLCLGGDRAAWDEFFRRFLPLLKLSIRLTLNKSKAKDTHILSDKENVIWEIYESIVIKLFKNGFLHQCVDPTGIRSWLKEVAQNQARTWIRGKFRHKHLVQRQAENATGTLDNPLLDDSETTLGDTIASDADRFQQTFCTDYKALKGRVLKDADIYRHERIYIELLLPRIELLKKSANPTHHRNYWIMRLSLMNQLPLAEEDSEQLAEFSPLTADDFRSRIDAVTNRLTRRETKRTAELGRAIAYWCEIRRLESKLREISGDDTPNGVAYRRKLVETIALYERRRNKLLKSGQLIPRPTNKEIAEFVGIPAIQSGQVTIILTRLRMMLKAKVLQPEDDAC